MKLGTVLALILFAFASGCSRKDAAKADPQAAQAASKAAGPISVKAVPVVTKSVERTIDVTGSILPDDTVNLGFAVPGRIAVINYDFGQSVKKGAVIAELDKREIQIQLDRAKAALAQAMARVGLDANQDSATPSDTPAMRQALAQFEDARSKFENAKKLVASGDIARERFTEAEKTFEARRAAYEATKDDLRTQLANIQAMRADVRLAEKHLSDTSLRAPFDGVVSDKPVAPGQYVKDNNTIVTLVKSWPLRLRLDIPEVAAGGIKLGDTLKFTTEAVPDAQFTATVRQLNPALDSRSRSLSAEARLNQADQRLKPGMFVQVRVTVAKSVPIITVPKNAVYTVAGLTKLFVIRDNKAHEIRFTPGQVGDDWVEVPANLVKPGDVVAIENLHLLSENLDVRAS